MLEFPDAMGGDLYYIYASIMRIIFVVFVLRSDCFSWKLLVLSHLQRFIGESGPVGSRRSAPVLPCSLRGPAHGSGLGSLQLDQYGVETRGIRLERIKRREAAHVCPLEDSGKIGLCN